MERLSIVEHKFEYKGHECICTFTKNGTRCGYVSVDSNIKFDITAIKCHGGITYQDSLPKEFLPEEEFYIGFDCAHAEDLRDYEQAYKYGLLSNDELKSYKNSPIRTEECQPHDLQFVIKNCKIIVDYLVTLNFPYLYIFTKSFNNFLFKYMHNNDSTGKAYHIDFTVQNSKHLPFKTICSYLCTLEEMNDYRVSFACIWDDIREEYVILIDIIGEKLE